MNFEYPRFPSGHDETYCIKKIRETKEERERNTTQAISLFCDSMIACNKLFRINENNGPQTNVDIIFNDFSLIIILKLFCDSRGQKRLCPLK